MDIGLYIETVLYYSPTRLLIKAPCHFGLPELLTAAHMCIVSVTFWIHALSVMHVWIAGAQLERNIQHKAIPLTTKTIHFVGSYYKAL